MISRLTALIFILSGFAFSLDPVNPDLIDDGREILNYFESIYGSKMLAGYNVYSHTADDYEQTGKQSAVWGRDLRWGNPQEIAHHVLKGGYILTIHWHWDYRGDLRRKNTNKNLDMSRVITEGTEENIQLYKELDEAAEKLQVYEDSGVVVLFRPLHEIDGGWFWWTDKENPENTAQLWRIMFDYFTNVKELDNLIWVYSAGVPLKKTVEFRKGFYPGDEYVDISGIDIYNADFENDPDIYQAYYDTMSLVTPNKMLALSEAQAMPNPDFMQSGDAPTWLWCMPWYGVGFNGRSNEWGKKTMHHEHVITLDEMPPLGSTNLQPHIGIISPWDDGSGDAWFNENDPTLYFYAVDRDGSIDRVEFYTHHDNLAGTVTEAPWQFQWENAPRGSYFIHAIAYDDKGKSSTSNHVRIHRGLKDVARNTPVTVSSGEKEDQAVDGDYYTNWQADKSSGDQWIYVDLQEEYTISRTNLFWSWKIHATDFNIEVATENPENPASWTVVDSVRDFAYDTWKAANFQQFAPVKARYVKLHALKRASNQTWGGYKLTAFEVLVDQDMGSGVSIQPKLKKRIPGSQLGNAEFDISGRKIEQNKQTPLIFPLMTPLE